MGSSIRAVIIPLLGFMVFTRGNPVDPGIYISEISFDPIWIEVHNGSGILLTVSETTSGLVAHQCTCSGNGYWVDYDASELGMLSSYTISLEEAYGNGEGFVYDKVEVVSPVTQYGTIIRNIDRPGWEIGAYPTPGAENQRYTAARGGLVISEMVISSTVPESNYVELFNTWGIPVPLNTYALEIIAPFFSYTIHLDTTMVVPGKGYGIIPCPGNHDSGNAGICLWVTNGEDTLCSRYMFEKEFKTDTAMASYTGDYDEYYYSYKTKGEKNRPIFREIYFHPFDTLHLIVNNEAVMFPQGQTITGEYLAVGVNWEAQQPGLTVNGDTVTTADTGRYTLTARYEGFARDIAVAGHRLVKRSRQLGPETNLYCAGFKGDFGILGGLQGHYVTNDKGYTWTYGEGAGIKYYESRGAVEVFDTAIYFLGDSVTFNGGKSWQRTLDESVLDKTVPMMRQVKMYEGIGYVHDNRTIYITRDTCKTWSILASQVNGEACFYDDSTIYVGRDSTHYYIDPMTGFPTDMRFWTFLDLYHAGSGLVEHRLTGREFFEVRDFVLLGKERFLMSTGYGGILVNENDTLWRRYDCGIYLRQVISDTEHDLYWGISDSGIYYSTTAGRNWARYEMVTGYRLNNMMMSDQRELYVLGNNGYLLNFYYEGETTPVIEKSINESRQLKVTGDPNPFRSVFRVSSPGMAQITVKIYDMQGYIVNELKGRGNITWPGRDSRGREVNNGIYYIVVKAGGARGGLRTVKTE